MKSALDEFYLIGILDEFSSSAEELFFLSSKLDDCGILFTMGLIFMISEFINFFEKYH